MVLIAIHLLLWHSLSAIASCEPTDELRLVRGQSMAGIFSEGDEIHLLRGFYDCNQPQRNDIIAYRYAGHGTLLAKIIKGVPGDHFSLEAASGGWHLRINNTWLATSGGIPYLLNDRSYRILSLYENSYHGVIPADAFLILGNRPEGTLDSSRFGLVNKSDIVGKILLKGHLPDNFPYH